MPGTFIIKPIEASLTHDTDIIGKMNPYCAVVVGNTKSYGQVCKHGGKHPYWNDAITLPATNESKVVIELMDRDLITHDDNIGSLVLDLQEVEASGKVVKWYPLTYKNKSAGEILLETVFQPDALLGQYHQQEVIVKQDQYSQQADIQNQIQVLTSQPQVVQDKIIDTIQPAHLAQGTTTQETVKTDTTTTQPAVVSQEEIILNEGARRVWTEQHQVVEPHKFTREVDVYEVKPDIQEVEVLEPVKVIKEVPYTEAVPVKVKIEVMEPQVVVKDVEMIEPRLVTKVIQVVENVPVIRQIEVLEMRSTIKEVDTYEPQTLTKEVELTEYVPIKKAIEVTKPVVVKKALEFNQPVTTTYTTTKRLQESVHLDEEITTSVGPSVVGISYKYGYIPHWGEISLDERKRVAELVRWAGFEKLFTGLTEQERLFEQLRLSRLSEQEWLQEQQRLLGMPVQDRIREQKEVYVAYYRNQGGLQTGFQGEFLTGQARWHGFEHLLSGLSEKERLFEQERWNRLSEQEWLHEQQRLLAMPEQDRIREQKEAYVAYYRKQGGLQTGFQGEFLTGHERWRGFEHLLSGLNEKESLFEQERWNRLTEQEWLEEQKRLSAFNEVDRLLEQRRLYNDHLQTGGLSTYKKTIGIIEQATIGGRQSLHSSTYHPSPHF